MGKTRYDVLVCCEDLNLRISPGIVESYLRALAVNRIVRPAEEAIAETWAEIYMEPGASAHEPFVRGGNPSTKSVFLEAMIRFGTKAVAMPYGVKKQQLNFYLEFRGCQYDDVMGPFRKRFQDILKKRPAVYVRKHTKLPRHREVPEGEEPVEKDKRSTGGGFAGTRVEEF